MKINKDLQAIEQSANIFASDGTWQCPVSFIVGAKSTEAKSYHTKGMYSEKEVKNLVYEFCYELGFSPDKKCIDKWFNKNKNK